MEQNSHLDLSQYSDSELKEIVINRFHRGSMITAARKELEKRNISLTADEIKQKESIKETRIKEAKKNPSPLKAFVNEYNEYIVTDESAPELYTRRILYIFSVIFSVLFGAVMFSMNLVRLKKHKYIALVVLYSIIYVVLIIYIQNNAVFTRNTFLFNILGYLPIDLMWNKFIGKTTYRKRSLLVPTIIGVILTGLTILSIVYP